MGRFNDQPFPRGNTWYNGGYIPNFLSPPPDYSGQPGGFNLEGKEYEFEDETYGTGFYVKVRCVRNNSGINIKPGQLCTFTTTYVDNVTIVSYGTCVGSVCTTEAADAFPADEFLPPAGVPQGDLFYVVVKGPCLLTTDTSLAAAITAGEKVVACSATGTTSTNAGAIIPQDTTQVTAPLYNQIQNAVGRALSACSSGGTATQILVGVKF